MAFKLTSLFDLTGRTALVTGGNSGIGMTMARALGMAGASLILVARRESVLESAAASLTHDGLVVTTIAADLAAKDAHKKIGAASHSKSLTVDIVVNAAGVNLRRPFAEVSADNFDLHMALHLRAPFLLTQTFAPAMAKRGWGRIITIASLQSWRAFPDSAPYGTAKGGVLQLTRAIAEEWSRHGVTCNAIAPGFFPTPLTEPVFGNPERASHVATQTAMGRNGHFTDLVGATVFLASDASSYITGQTLAIDGGFTAK